MQNVQSLAVAFYDGTNWQTSWSFNTADSGTNSSTTATSGSSASADGSETLPVAIRVDIQQAPAAVKDPEPAPIEVMVPWTTQPFTSPTPAPTP